MHNDLKLCLFCMHYFLEIEGKDYEVIVRRGTQDKSFVCVPCRPEAYEASMRKGVDQDA